MTNRSGKLNVAHSFSADNGTGNLNAAFFANDAFVANASVFSAVTFKIFIRPEDFLVKQTVAFAPLGSVIDCFRLGDFPVRPLPDAVRRSELQLDGVEIG